MSYGPAAAVRRPTSSSRPDPAPRPNLRLATPPKRRIGRLVYLTVCLTVLVGALVAVLSINTALAKGAFEIHQMERDLANLEAQATKLEELLADQAGPEVLAAKATELGMVPAPNTSYILLQEGTIIGPAESSDGVDDQ